MGKIIRGNKEESVKNGEYINEAAKRLGIPFSCNNGICGTCVIDIEEGEENLSSLNEKEKDLGMGGGMRLACQCKLKKGTIKIK